jgi:polyferredoxin
MIPVRARWGIYFAIKVALWVPLAFFLSWRFHATPGESAFTALLVAVTAFPVEEPRP